MADKEIAILPQVDSINEETKFPVYNPNALNPAQHATGEQLAAFAREGGAAAMETVGRPLVEAAAASAASAAASAKQAADQMEDLRTGYDGTVYESAGEAVREQVTQAMESAAFSVTDDDTGGVVVTVGGSVSTPSKSGSTYFGKKVSVIGDSISTFAGYVPSGNSVHYNGSNGGVSSVNEMWWKRVINALGAELLVNESWSGSRVTTTGGTISAACMSRCENLGNGETNPDVIIAYIGINDFINEVSLGTYDGTTTLPTNTDTFREAYSIMLNKILTKYPYAEVWVCTLPYCERNAGKGFPETNDNGVTLFAWNKAIKEIADLFGVRVLDLWRCGLTYQNLNLFAPDSLHPNANGHAMIANYVISHMDNAVRMRF